MTNIEIQQLEHVMSLFDNITHIEIHGKTGKKDAEVAISDRQTIKRVLSAIRYSIESEKEPICFKLERGGEL